MAAKEMTPIIDGEYERIKFEVASDRAKIRTMRGIQKIGGLA
jgi:hypothetical protein